MAQGAQLCCGPPCEDEARRRVSARWLRRSHALTEVAAFAVVLAILGFAVALRWA
jgi:hypothetical protein